MCTFISFYFTLLPSPTWFVLWFWTNISSRIFNKRVLKGNSSLSYGEGSNHRYCLILVDLLYYFPLSEMLLHIIWSVCYWNKVPCGYLKFVSITYFFAVTFIFVLSNTSASRWISKTFITCYHFPSTFSRSLIKFLLLSMLRTNELDIGTCCWFLLVITMGYKIKKNGEWCYESL